MTGSPVILVSFEPWSDGATPPQTLSKEINEEEDIVLQLHILQPELDHQSPEDVPGTADIDDCRDSRDGMH